MAFAADDTTTEQSVEGTDDVDTSGPTGAEALTAFTDEPEEPNPDLPGQCGLDIAVVYDLSNSIEDGELTQFRDAGATFVDALAGTPSQVGLFNFASFSPAHEGAENAFLGLTSVATPDGATAVKNAITGLSRPNTNSGATNWEAGLQGPRDHVDDYDAVVFLTDGDPTVHNDDHRSGASSDAADVAAAVPVANDIKASGTKVIAVGVEGATVANLQVISGYDENDDYYVTNFDELATTLDELASTLCDGTVTVVKQLRDADGVLTPGAGWTFAAEGEGVTPASGGTDDNGAINFAVDFEEGGSDDAREVTITETQQDGYRLAQQGGANALCTVDGNPVDIVDVDLGFTTKVGPNDTVTCTVINEVIPQSWTLAKSSDPEDGSTVEPGDEVTYTLAVENTGDAAVEGIVVSDDLTDVLDDAAVTDGPSATLGSAEITATTLTWTIDSLPAGESATVSYTVTVDDDAWSSNLRNVVTGTGDVPPDTCPKPGHGTTGDHPKDECDTDHPTPDLPTFTLVKKVVNDNGGTAEATAWTLAATGTDDAISGVTGTPEVTEATVRAGTYELSEDGPLGYSASEWACEGGTQDGASVALAYGEHATCTITNDDDPAELTLEKIVDDNGAGGDAVPSDWTLTAEGPTTISGPSGSDEVTGATVDAGDYALSEDGPSGYTPGEWACAGGVVDGDTVAVPNGGSVLCQITNTAEFPTLTLVKEVENEFGGAAVPTDWTLSADGPTPVSGVTGDATVTDAAVQAGKYELGEFGGPDGYDAQAWVCEGGALDGSTLTLGVGEHATCTIVNTQTDGPVDLAIDKDDREAVAAEGESFEYGISVVNVGNRNAHGVTVTDEIPAELSVDDASIVAPDGWTAGVAGEDENGFGGTFTATYDGVFAPGDTAEFTFTVTVGELVQADPSLPYADIVNTAVVTSDEDDENPDDNSDTEETPVESVTLVAEAVCRNDVPWLDYTVAAHNYDAAEFTLNWWNTEVWNDGEPTGDPSVATQIPLDELSGSLLWPGAAVDENGNPTDWPGWSQDEDGNWFPDPDAPGADLVPTAVVEIVSNPSVDAVQVYPPATPNCDASPPDNPDEPEDPVDPEEPDDPEQPDDPDLPDTGADLGGLVLLGGLLMVGGVVVAVRRRNGSTTG